VLSWGPCRGIIKGHSQKEELKEHNGVQRSPVGSQNSSSGVSSRKKMTVCHIVNCRVQLYKGPIHLIIKSKTRLISHANPGYVTVHFNKSPQYPILRKSVLNNPQINKNEDHDEKLYRCKYKVWNTLDTISNRIRSVFIKDHKPHIPWCETGRLQSFVFVRDCCIIHALRGTTPPLLNLIYMPSLNTLPLSVFSCVKTNITLLYVHATRDMDWRAVFLLHVAVLLISFVLSPP
jgi:hypothetical protein